MFHVHKKRWRSPSTSPKTPHQPWSLFSAHGNSGQDYPFTHALVAQVQDAGLPTQPPLLQDQSISGHVELSVADSGSDEIQPHGHQSILSPDLLQSTQDDPPQPTRSVHQPTYPHSPPRAPSPPLELQATVDEESVDDIDELQDQLRDAREELLGARSRLKEQRRSLRDTRDNTVAQLGRAFDHTRRYFLFRGLEVPFELEAEWSKVDDLRDTLGDQETEYEMAEERYNMQEWRYTKKETSFVDNFVTSIPEAISSASMVKDAVRDTANLTRYSFIPSLSGSLHSDLTPPASPPRANDQFLVPSPLKMPNRVGFPLAGEGISPLQLFSPARLSALNLAQMLEGTDLPVEASFILQRIDNWILDCLEVSSVHRRTLSNFVPQGQLNPEDWWQTIVHYWNSDNLQRSVFHTGDTSSSVSYPSQSLSKNLKSSIDTSSGSEQLDTRPSSVTPPSSKEKRNASPLISVDKKIDALEPSEFPATIRIRDLTDAPRHVHFLVRSQSAQCRSKLRGSLACITSAPGSSASSYTTEEGTIRQSRSPSVESTRAYNHVSIPDFVHAAPVFLSTTSTDYIRQHVEVSDVRVYKSNKPVFQSDVITSSDSDAVVPEPDLESSEVGSLKQRETRSPDVGEQEPVFGPRFYSAAKYQTRHPFASFIRVKGQKPWSLPLLRLTPFPNPSATNLTGCNSYTRLNAIPFVDTADTPFRLPGPSTMLLL